MPQNALHIIAFDIPFPANYGGVIVVYYHLKALAEKGVKIILHCFEYGDRHPQDMLLQYCDEVYYYARNRSLIHQFSSQPFIVKTRKHPDLLKRLLQDEFPILMEGIHCCAYLDHPALAKRLKLVRMHNIEWQYYRNLAKLEKGFPQKAYLYLESIKLKNFENKILKHADCILTLTPLDRQYFEKYPTKVVTLGPFHGNEQVSSQLGQGDYVLFHGKLSVEDNEKAAIFLIQKVMSAIDMKFIVAGMNPTRKLSQLLQRYPQMKLIANPSEQEMQQLIQNAQINILLSFQVAGIKLKLLNALYQGRHCIANSTIIEGTRLEKLCEIANSAEEMIKKTKLLASTAFNSEQIKERKSVLSKMYANESAAQKMIEILEKERKSKNNHFQ